MNIPKLVPYTVRLYRSGPEAHAFAEEELERIQEGHLEFVASQRAWTYANGPFRNQPDETLRGIGIMRSSVEETLAAVQAGDPAVLAGRMRAEVFTWLVPEGMLPWDSEQPSWPQSL
jgi:uncharacterized protein